MYMYLWLGSSDCSLQSEGHGSARAAPPTSGHQEQRGSGGLEVVCCVLHFDPGTLVTRHLQLYRIETMHEM